MKGRIYSHFILIIAGWAMVVVCGSAPAAGQTTTVSFPARLQKAYFEIQKLRIEGARQLIESERREDPDNAFITYLDNYADLHYLLISEDKAAFKRLSDLEDSRLATIGYLPETSPYKKLFLADIRLHWAFAKLKFGNQVSGSWEIIKAYKLLDENNRRFPKFIPTLKSLGLLHVLIGSIPENYAWVTKILGLKGNVDQGIRELRKVEQEGSLFQQEASLIDLLLHAYTLQLTPDQQQKIRHWPAEQPDNLLLHFFAVTVLMKEGKSEEASTYLAEAPQGPAYIAFPFLDYLRAEILLQKGLYDEANAFYLKFLKNYKGFNYIKDSNFKRFMCLWLTGNDREATIYAKKTVQEGSTIIEADQLAKRMAEEFLNGTMTDRQQVLFKARYATDGGFLTRAAQLIDSVNEGFFNTNADKCEYHYRKARILQKSGRAAAAVAPYQRALQLASDAPGFGASSSLQLGYIFLERHEEQKAASYFRKALSYKKYEYKNSIDNKARAALTGLEEKIGKKSD